MNQNKTTKPKTTPIWFRIGGYLNLTKKELVKFQDNPDDITNNDFLAILNRGVELSGDTYPYDNEECLNDDNAIYLDPEDVVVIPKSAYKMLENQTDDLCKIIKLVSSPLELSDKDEQTLRDLQYKCKDVLNDHGVAV